MSEQKPDPTADAKADDGADIDEAADAVDPVVVDFWQWFAGVAPKLAKPQPGSLIVLPEMFAVFVYRRWNNPLFLLEQLLFVHLFHLVAIEKGFGYGHSRRRNHFVAFF